MYGSYMWKIRTDVCLTRENIQSESQIASRYDWTASREALRRWLQLVIVHEDANFLNASLVALRSRLTGWNS